MTDAWCHDSHVDEYVFSQHLRYQIVDQCRCISKVHVVSVSVYVYNFSIQYIVYTLARQPSPTHGHVWIPGP